MELKLIQKELNELVYRIKNDNLIEKSDIIEKLENIIETIEQNYKYKKIIKPNPIINQPSLNDFEINNMYKKESDTKELDEFLNFKQNYQEKLIQAHENNLEELPIQNDLTISLTENTYNYNKTHDYSEETYLSPFLNDSKYIQMKKFN
jgi:hypothetical protein